MKPGGSWSKSSPELVAAFDRAIASLSAEAPVERRKMFGYPAGFLAGNLFTGLFQEQWFVRLDEPARTELLAFDGAATFAPAPDRPMKAYVVLPPAVRTDPAALHRWLHAALAFAATLPPKPAP